jgi:hypothetical protein
MGTMGNRIFSVSTFVVMLIVATPFSGRALADDNPTTAPTLLGIRANDNNPAFNVEPTTRTNETTVTVHLIGAEGWYDAVHLAEDVEFSSNTQSFWRPPLGDYDGGTTVTFILSSGDTLKTIWAVLDNASTISLPPTSATLILDTTQPDVTSSTLRTEPNLRLHVTMEFSEAVHEFTADDIWLGGVAVSVENFAGEGTEYSFDVVASGEGQLTIGFYTDDVFDLAGNPVIEQASPLVEYYPFILLETPGATESAELTGGLFGLLAPSLLSLEESGGGQSMMSMGTMDPVWVDFDWQTPEEGTEESPFNTLQEGLENVVDSGTVIIKAGTSAETLTIDQPVRLESSDGTARIGDPAAATTEYFPLPIGMPINTPMNGVVGQVLAASGAQQLDLAIESVRTVQGETVTTVPNNWFELQPMENGNFNLIWKAPLGVDLSDYDRIEVSVNRTEGAQSTHHATWTHHVTQPDENTRWVFYNFSSNVDNWRMKVGPHVLTVTEGTVFGWWYAYDIDKSYAIEIKRTAILHSPSPVPYLGWEAFTFNLGTPVNGWQGSASGAWIHDPDNIVGTEILAQAKNPGGGKATMIVDDLSMKLSPNQPVPLSAGTERLFLTRTDAAADNTLRRRNVILKWRGLNRLKAKGLTDSEVVLTLSQSTGTNDGRVRVYARYGGGDPILIMPQGQDSVAIDPQDFDSQESIELIVEGAAAGPGALAVALRGAADSQSVHTDSVNYHVIEPFTISLAESARVYNEKRVPITMEPELEPPAGEDEEAWLSKRRLVIFHDCGTGNENNGTTTLEPFDDAPAFLPVFFAYEKLEGSGTPVIIDESFLLPPLFPTATKTLTFFSDAFNDLDPDYKVHVGFDTNSNGDLDEAEKLAAFELHLVTADNYEDADDFLDNLSAGNTIPALDELALNLVTKFYTGSWNSTVSSFDPTSASTTIVRGSNNSNTSISPHSLTHDFDSTAFSGRWGNLTAEVPLYIFDDGSAASTRIEVDSDFQGDIQNYIQSPGGIGYSHINQEYQSPTTPMTFSDQFVVINPGSFDTIFRIGTGGFHVLGDITFKAEEVSGGYNITDISVDMVARDLFDYNYFNLLFYDMLNLKGPQAGGSYQAGMGRCGNMFGDVFVTHIYINATIPGSVFVAEP